MLLGLLWFAIILSALNCTNKHREEMENEIRIKRNSQILLNGPVEKVFPLFGAVEESKWADGWEIDVVFSNDPLLEENMVFTTDSHDGEEYLTWIVSKLDNDNHCVKYTVFGDERLWTIDIVCAYVSNRETMADVTYTFTGLSDEGRARNLKMANRIYADDLKDWSEMINYYLETGLRLELQH